MARSEIRFVSRSVDSSPTLAGRILQAAQLRHKTGPDWEGMRLYPARAAVLLVHGGGVFRDTRGFHAKVRPGDLLLIHPKIAHTYGPPHGGKWEEWYVAFEGPIFDALETCGVLDFSRPVWRLGDFHPWLAEFKTIFPSAGRVAQASNQVGALAAWLLSASAQAKALAMPEAARDAAWLARARQRLEIPGEEYGDLREVARDCGAGYESFRKRFTALSGESPARYRRGQLISRAQTLMREHALPDRAIAAALGFCDEFHFSKTFKSLVGCSPREWKLRGAVVEGQKPHGTTSA